MLVPSMNTEEVKKEIDKDYPVIFRKASYVAHKIYRLFTPAKNKTVNSTCNFIFQIWSISHLCETMCEIKNTGFVK